MPLYEYECEACGKRFERIQKFSDPPIDVCAHCGKGPVKKLLSSPAIQFKGSGFYITDYPKKSAGESGSKSETKSETTTKETKSESKDTGASSSTAKTDTAKKD